MAAEVLAGFLLRLLILVPFCGIFLYHSGFGEVSIWKDVSISLLLSLALYRKRQN